MIDCWSVPKLWPGGTVLCIGGGPSLTRDDAKYAMDRCSGTIGINDAYRLQLPIDIIYAADHKWWNNHYQPVMKAYPDTIKITVMEMAAREYPELKFLKCAQYPGWSDQPNMLHGGGHSGYQAINLAMLAGASRILLLGYDFQGTHWFGKHPDNSRQDFPIWQEAARGTYNLAKNQGVEIINVSRETSLEEYPRRVLEEVLL
jgi:hypothetical protein